MEKVDNRDKKVIQTSILTIAANMFLVLAKVAAGILSGSIAIVVDALNNFTDAVSSIVTIIGLYFASKKPDKDHPLGHGRIEYLSAIIVAIIVIYAGLTAAIESISKILHPEITEYTAFTVVVLVITIAAKFILGNFVKKQGETLDSPALEGSGVDAINDAYVSAAVLISAAIYMTLNIQLDAYVGLVISIIIMASGIELLIDDIGDILGKRLDRSIINSVNETILNDDAVLGVHDLILHNYGPNRNIGTVIVDVDSDMRAADIDLMTRRIQGVILQEYNVYLSSIGICSMDKAHNEMRTEIEKRLSHIDHIMQIHGISIDSDNKMVDLDLVIDFDDKYPDQTMYHARMHLIEAFPDYTFCIHRDADI